MMMIYILECNCSCRYYYYYYYYYYYQQFSTYLVAVRVSTYYLVTHISNSSTQ